MRQRLWTTGATVGARDAHVCRDRQPWCGEAVMIVDVAELAAIRACHGDAVGEQATRAVADCLGHRLRADDRLALLREDEFLMVLGGTPAQAVPALAQRLRTDVAALRLSLAGRIWTLTCTIGAATRGTRPCGLEALVRAADGDLDRARRESPGRLPA